jgi:glycosyltransferase involved in cell wall biosynthesis
MFPHAPIYTSIFNGSTTYPDFGNLDVRVSALQGKVRPEHFRLAALRYAGAFRELPVGDTQYALASSSAFAHHISHPAKFVYCHTPPRFLYDPSAYTRFGPFAAAVQPILDRLRRQDCAAAWNATSYAANSAATAQRIKAVYGIDARIIYPPLATGHLGETLEPPPTGEPRALVVARLQPYKRVDLAISACRRAKIPLTIIGDGPEKSRLRNLADDTVTMLGRVGDTELADAFASHSVVLATGREDFGYAPIEANYAGRPVVARRIGGFLETVVDGETGILVDGEDVGEWAAAIHAALERTWSQTELRASTAKYQVPAFSTAIRGWLGLASQAMHAESIPRPQAHEADAPLLADASR